MFPKRFLPAPVKMRRTQAGPEVPLPSDEKASDFFPNLGTRLLLDKMIGVPNMPHDRYCPSKQKNLDRRVCPECGIYYPSMAALKRHQKGAGCAGHVDADNEPESDSETEVIGAEAHADEDDRAPILNIFELLQNPVFTEDVDSDDED